MLCLSLGGLWWWLSDLGLGGGGHREDNKGEDGSSSRDTQTHSWATRRPPGLFAAGLPRDGRDDFPLFVGFVRDGLRLCVALLPLHLGGVSLRPRRLRALGLRASLPVGVVAVRALPVRTLAPLSPLLLGRRRHRVLLGHLLGDQLGVDPGFPADGTEARDGLAWGAEPQQRSHTTADKERGGGGGGAESLG